MTGDAPARRGSARLIAVMTVGVLVALLLVFVVLNLDPEAPRQSSANDGTPIEELVTPRPFDSGEPHISIGDVERAGPSIDVPTGGFIEVAGPDGRAEQRYRFDRLDPAPEGLGPGWLNATNPTVQLINDEQLIVMRAESALLYAPNRAIESGTLEGGVLVEMFDVEDPAADLDSLSPSVTVRTGEASYDHILGEIRCDGRVDIDAVQGKLPGRGLRVLIDDEGRQRYSMHLERMDYLLIRDAPEPTPNQNEVAVARDRDDAVDRDEALRPDSGRDDSRETSAATAAQWYQVTFQDDVRVQHGIEGEGQRAAGDALTIRFSAENDSIGGAFAWGAPRSTRPLPHTALSAPLTRDQAFAAIAIAAVGDDDPFLPPTVPQPGPNETIITCAGPLTIKPLDDAEKIPDDPDDVVIELEGAPATLRDDVKDSDGSCGMLRYRMASGAVDLLRRSDHGVELRTPDVAIGADHLWLNDEQQRAGVIGAGWMEPRDEQQDDAPPPVDDAAEDAADPLVQMRITWQEGVELKFLDSANAEEPTQLQRAEFKGDVTVDGDRGYVGANVLDLHFRLNDAGKSVPERMIANTDVKVKDDDVTLWSDDLLVTLREAAPATPATDAEPGVSPVEGDDPMMRFGDDIEIDTILATKNVQILLSNGSRAFAEQFEADAANEHAVLTGENVTVISNRMIVDRGTRMELVRTGNVGTITVPGPGEAVILSRDIDVSADQRIERPVIDTDENPRQVGVTWNKRMHYDGAFGDAAGAVEFEGEVDAMVEPNQNEEQAMAGEFLRLEFANRDAAAKAELTEGEPPADAFTSDRALHRLVVRNGSLESRAWRTEDRESETPRLFSIAGPEIVFNNATQAASVTGAGELLIQDLTPDADNTETGDDDSAFGGKGTTYFTWTESLQLVPLVEDDFRVTFAGDVELRHMSLDNLPSTLTASELEAEIARPDAAERPSSAELDFGGAAELQRVIGRRNVLIRTTRYTIDADQFDYNVALGQARISAEAGRTARVIDRTGSGAPVFVRDAVWNMNTNAIQLTDIGGG